MPPRHPNTERTRARPAPASERRMLEQLGITRVGRLTGLDRVGVEVASAIRPLGHVLQVSNGKGRRFEQAREGAISEAAELTCSEQVDPGRLRWASARWLRSQRLEPWLPGRLGSAGALVAPELWSEDLRMAWLSARTLPGPQAPREVWVPACAVYCPPAGQPLGPAVVGWSTNGLGAHRTLTRALDHALLEAIERDQLARALPRGWTAAVIQGRRIGEERLAASAPEVARARRALGSRAIALHLFDLTPTGQGSLGLPVAGALLIEPEGMIPVTSGYACAPRWDQALEAAFFEAAQARLTDIHGAREDIAPPDLERDAILIQWASAKAKGRAKTAAAGPVETASGAGGARVTPREVLRRRGVEVAWVDLSLAGLGRRVVKVIVPSFLQTELL